MEEAWVAPSSGRRWHRVSFSDDTTVTVLCKLMFAKRRVTWLPYRPDSGRCIHCYARVKALESGGAR